MQGADRIRRMRREGKAPLLVNIDTDPDKLRLHWQDWPGMEGEAQMQIAPDDALHRLDLRCLVGLIVAVSGSDPARVAMVAEACKAAGAHRVIGTTHEREEGPGGPWFRATCITDTEGVLTWRA